jgi:phosphohistidine phosphatase
MKRVHLLRHAKSSWKAADLSDVERPLAGRGRRAADAIARHVAEEGIEPDLVLCSPARRTVETLERIRPALGASAVQIEPELYGADAGSLLGRLRRVSDDVESVMVVGHNPAMQELALGLARPGALASEIAAKYPTGALATLEAPIDGWGALERGGAALIGFTRPRDLER